LFIFDTEADARRALEIMQGIFPNITLGDYSIGKQCHFLDLSLTLVGNEISSCSRSGCRISHSVYRKPCDLRVLIDFSSARSLGVKLSTLFSQCVRFWRLCDCIRTAVSEIRTLLAAMIRFRHLSRPLAVRTLRRFRWWVVTRTVCCKLHITAAVRRHRGTRNTLCVLPAQLNTRIVRKALHAIRSRLSASEQKWTGSLSVVTQSNSHLDRLLF
jgi:hypothetical protein